MALAIDASSPASVTGNASATTTTAAFSPPANVYLVACIANDNSAASVCVGTVTDSISGTWTLLKRSNVNQATAEVWGKVQSAAQTNMTVSCTFTNGFNSPADAVLSVQVLTGASTTQPGTTNSASGTVDTVAITPQQVGSYIFGTLNRAAGATTYAANANSTILKANADSASGSTQWTFRSTSTTASLASVTYGSSTAAATLADIVGVEIVPSGSVAAQHRLMLMGIGT